MVIEIPNPSLEQICREDILLDTLTNATYTNLKVETSLKNEEQIDYSDGKFFTRTVTTKVYKILSDDNKIDVKLKYCILIKTITLKNNNEVRRLNTANKELENQIKRLTTPPIPISESEEKPFPIFNTYNIITYIPPKFITYI